MKNHPNFQHRDLHYLAGNGHQRPNKRRIEVATRIVLGLAGMVVVGTLLLMLPGMGVNGRLTFMQAFFTATSALTVTGLSTIAAGRDLTFAGQIVLLLLIQFGGVGYMFAAAAALRIIRRRVSLMDRLALSSSLGLDTPEAIMKVLKRSLIGILVIEGSGAFLLFWKWWLSGTVDLDHVFFYAIFHAVSAFCNAGFDLFNGLPQYPDGVPSDNFTLIVLGLLIGLGALGIPVLSELFTWRWRRRFSLHTRLTLAVVAFLIVFGWVGLWLPEATHGVLVDVPLGSQLVRTWFQSVSARTAGFAGLPHFDQLQPESRLMLIILMFIGSAPASMGGGLTTGTFAVLLLALWGYARGTDHTEIGGRRIAVGTVRRAGAVLTVGLFVVLTATWLILLVQDFTLDQVLFEVVSGFATCGLSLGITGQLNVFSQFIIAFVMFWGRLGALTIVSAIGQQNKRTQLVQYPEESVLIG